MVKLCGDAGSKQMPPEVVLESIEGGKGLRGGVIDFSTGASELRIDGIVVGIKVPGYGQPR